jgi:hypothetical protein
MEEIIGDVIEMAVEGVEAMSDGNTGGGKGCLAVVILVAITCLVIWVWNR